MTEETKEPLIGKTLEELRTLARDLGMPAFVGGQIARWLYVQHVKDINEMANISKKHRELLAQRFTVGCHAPIDAQYSKDGTIKYLFPVRALPRRSSAMSLSRRSISPTATAPRCVCRRRWAAR